jgi:hypothetical protein
MRTFASLLAVAFVAGAAGAPSATPTSWLPNDKRVFDRETCPYYAKTCAKYDDDIFQAQMTAVANPSAQNTQHRAMRNVANLASLSGTSQHQLQAGTYGLEYVAFDACNQPHMGQLDVSLQCNAPPMLNVSNTNVTVQFGAEVLVDASGSWDVNPEDTSKLSFGYCLMAYYVADDVRNGTVNWVEQAVHYQSVLRVDETTVGGSTIPREGVAYLRPPRTGLQRFDVAVMVSDGCNYVAKTVSVRVTAEPCPMHAAARVNTLEWQLPNPDYDFLLDGQESAETSCLPRDYSAQFGAYATRYSPYTEQAISGDQNGRSIRVGDVPTQGEDNGDATIASRDWPDVAGCTWPGASNFDSQATHDDLSCMCDAPSTSWKFGSCQRDMDAAAEGCTGVTQYPGDDTTLTFYKQRAVTSHWDGNCVRTDASQDTVHEVQAALDMRQKVFPVPTPSILARPSTSWGATVTYKYHHRLMQNHTAMEHATEVRGEDVKDCELLIHNYAGHLNTSMTVTEYDTLRSCLGTYDIELQVAHANDALWHDTDTVPVTVTCAEPPSVELLLSYKVLYDGERFVRADAPNTEWVQIDARTSTIPNNDYSDSVWKWDTTAPPAHYYPGASTTGPLAGAHPLGGDDGFELQWSGSEYPVGYLKPMRGSAAPGGAFTVKLTADDGCNDPVSDTVTVTSECLEIHADDMMHAEPSNPSSDGSTVASTTLKVHNTPTKAYSGDQSTLYSAWRVASRPVWSFGDMFGARGVNSGIPAGVEGNTFECMLGEGWALNTPGSHVNASDAGDIDVSLPLEGKYVFRGSLVDGCASDHEDVTVTVSCSGDLPARPSSPTTPLKSVFENGAWPSITFPEAGISGSERAGWYLTAAPDADPVHAWVVNQSPDVTFPACSAYGATWPAVGLIAPDKSSPDAVRGISAIASGNTLDLTPAAVGQYSVTVQRDNSCKHDTYPFTAQAVCNDPAAFVGTPSAFPSASTYDCSAGHMQRVVLAAASDAGGDSASAGDTQTIMWEVVNSPPTSWYGKKYARYVMEYDLYIPDHNDTRALLAQNFTTGASTDIHNAISGVATATVAAALSISDASRVSLSETDDEQLGVTIEPRGCFVPTWGRVFRVTVGVAVHPDPFFSFFTPGNPEQYQHMKTGTTDLRPLGVLNDAMTAAVQQTTLMAQLTANAFDATYGAGRIRPFAGVQEFPVVAPTIVASADAYAPYAAVTQATAGRFWNQGTTFVPDLAGGVWEWRITVHDDCPGTTPATQTVSVTSTPYRCAAGYGATVSAEDPKTAPGAARSWVNRGTHFNTTYNLAATLTKTFARASAPLSNPETTNVQVTGSGSSLLVTFCQQPNTASVYAVTTGSLANGASVKFSATVGDQGGELRLSCRTSPTSNVDIAIVPSGSSNAPFHVPIPSACSRATALEWMQAPMVAADGAQCPSSPTVSAIEVLVNEEDAELSPACVDAGLSGTFVVGDTPVTAPMQVTKDSRVLDGSYAPLTPGSRAFKFQMQQPIMPWFNGAATCGVTSSSSATLRTQCLPLDPTISADNAAWTDLQFTSVSANIDGVNMQQYVDQSDVVTAWTMPSAPAGSAFDAATLIREYLAPELESAGVHYTGQGQYYTVRNEAYHPYSGRFTHSGSTALQRDVSINGKYGIWEQAYIDPADVTINLAAKSDPTVSYITVGRDQADELRAMLQSSTGFQPDYAGTYGLQASVSDGCQTRTATADVTVAQCPDPTVSVPQTSITADAVTGDLQGGLKRIPLTATVNGHTDRSSAAIRRITWSIVEAPVGAPSAYISNANSFKASLMPTMTGVWKVQVTADNGCRPLPAEATQVITITIPCAAPSPIFALTAEARGIVGTANATFLVQPNLAGGAQDWPTAVNIMGEPQCPSIASAWNVRHAQYSCPDPFTVQLRSVSPMVLPANVPGRLLTLTIQAGHGQPDAVTGGSLPSGVRNRNAADASAVEVTVNGKPCTDLRVVYEHSGVVTCRAPKVADPSMVTVVAKVFGQASTYTNTDITMSVVSPVITTAVPASGSPGLPTVGGTRVELRGHGVAFMPADAPDYRPEHVTVTIGGQPCTDVQVVSASTDAASSDGAAVTCTIPPGKGANVAVAMMTAYGSRYLDATLASVPVQGKFSYDAPVVTHTVPSAGRSVGGYPVTLTVRNLGIPGDYSDLTVGIVNGASVAPANVHVVRAETVDAPALLHIMMPPGCGDAAQWDVTRAGRSSADADASGSSVTFAYAAPVITCLGEPFTDPSTTGCARIVIDGDNLAGASEALQTMVTFHDPRMAYNASGSCLDVRVSGTGAYTSLSCRVPPSARPGHRVQVTNKCGQSSFAMLPSPAEAPALPNSIALNGCSSSFVVGAREGYSYDVEPAQIPAANSEAATMRKAMNVESEFPSHWNERPVSNGTFTGMFLGIILVFLTAGIVWRMAGNRMPALGNARGRRARSIAKATGGVQGVAGGTAVQMSRAESWTNRRSPTKQASIPEGSAQVTMNPVGGGIPPTSRSSLTAPAITTVPSPGTPSGQL